MKTKINFGKYGKGPVLLLEFLANNNYPHIRVYDHYELDGSPENFFVIVFSDEKYKAPFEKYLKDNS